MVIIDNNNIISNVPALVKVVKKSEKSVSFLVTVDVSKCVEKIGNNVNWNLSCLAGPKVSLIKNQGLIPLISFNKCIIGVGWGENLNNDPVAKKWMLKREEANLHDSK